MESLPKSYIDDSPNIKIRIITNFKTIDGQLFNEGFVEIKIATIIINIKYTTNRDNKLFKLRLGENKYVEQNKFKIIMMQATKISVVSTLVENCLDIKKDGVKMITELMKVKIIIYTFSLYGIFIEFIFIPKLSAYPFQ